MEISGSTRVGTGEQGCQQYSPRWRSLSVTPEGTRSRLLTGVTVLLTAMLSITLRKLFPHHGGNYLNCVYNIQVY